MKLHRISQIYLSLISMVLLILVGVGTYLYDSDGVDIAADVASIKTAKTDYISFASAGDRAALGDVLTLDLVGNFDNDPVTSAKIAVSFPPNMFEAGEIKTGSGLLGEISGKKVDKEIGLVELNFSPISPVNRSGVIAQINLTAKQKGVGTISYDQGLTVINTLSGVDILPTTADFILTIE